MARTLRITAPLIRDARWVLTFGPGTAWVTGGFSANRERDLVALGVLVPVVDQPGCFTVGAVDPDHLPTPA